MTTATTVIKTAPKNRNSNNTNNYRNNDNNNSNKSNNIHNRNSNNNNSNNNNIKSSNNINNNSKNNNNSSNDSNSHSNSNNEWAALAATSLTDAARPALDFAALWPLVPASSSAPWWRHVIQTVWKSKRKTMYHRCMHKQKAKL